MRDLPAGLKKLGLKNSAKFVCSLNSWALKERNEVASGAVPAWQINHRVAHCVLRRFREKVWEERDVKNSIVSRLSFR